MASWFKATRTCPISFAFLSRSRYCAGVRSMRTHCVRNALLLEAIGYDSSMRLVPCVKRPAGANLAVLT
jgi:hypothetical protein